MAIFRRSMVRIWTDVKACQNGAVRMLLSIFWGIYILPLTSLCLTHSVKWSWIFGSEVRSILFHYSRESAPKFVADCYNYDSVSPYGFILTSSSNVHPERDLKLSRSVKSSSEYHIVALVKLVEIDYWNRLQLKLLPTITASGAFKGSRRLSRLSFRAACIADCGWHL